MHRHMLGLRDELRLGVEHGAGGVHALLDVGREGGALQDGAHLVGGRFERVAQDFERDRIDGIAAGEAAGGGVIHPRVSLPGGRGGRSRRR